MILIAIIILCVLAIPASASSVISWTQEEIPGYNLTLNYTFSFNVAKNDTLGIIIKNVGNESINDTITIYEINVSSSEANGGWTGYETISPNSSKIIPFDLNVTTDDDANIDIKIYYNVSSDYKSLSLTANYPGALIITSWNSKKNNATILTWSPEVVDYVYVDNKTSETIDYSITTTEIMTNYNWSVDGIPVIESADDNSYSYAHTWDSDNVGFHTVIFMGNNGDTKVEFRWYVNVYEIGGYSGGNLFDVIDDALENHVTDLKIHMFKYKIAKHGGKSDIVAQKVNQLHDELAKRQMTREALRDEFKAGNISIQNYTAALRQAQFDAKFNSKLANEMAKMAKEELKDEELGKKFEKLSEKDKNLNVKKENTEKVKSKGLEKKSEIETSINKKEDSGNKGKSNENNNRNGHSNKQ